MKNLATTAYSKGRMLASFYLDILMILFFVLSIILFYFSDQIYNKKLITFFALIVVTLSIIVAWNNRNIKKFGYSMVVLLFTICTQFGLITVYFFVGENYVSRYSDNVLRFLYSDQYVAAVLLAIVAISSYVIATKMGSNKQSLYDYSKKLIDDAKEERNIVVFIGYALIITVIVYFLYFLLTGNLNLKVSYSEFRTSPITQNALYPYIIVIYATGIGYVVAGGTRKQIYIGMLLYLIPATIFFLTGNKGEVLYAVLACIGALSYRGFKFRAKTVLIIGVILFVIIPFITNNRNEGVLNNLENISVDLTSPFVEMGMQFRVSVYILEEIESSERELLYGFSYYNPIVNIIDKIIPFSIKLSAPDDFNFKDEYERKGFSQIAESYANFGLLGVILYHMVLGYLLSRTESNQLRVIGRAYFTSIVVVIINATRNKFAFVPGQIVLLTMLYFAILLIIKVRMRGKHEKN